MRESLQDRQKRAIKIIQTLQKATKGMPEPAASSIVAQFGQDPYLVLISCVLSLRTKDTVSLPASLRLFKVAKTPKAMLAIPIKKIEQLIYPAGFYRQKAKNIHEISYDILECFGGTVPSTLDDLLSLKGVGPKTANLVLAQGFNIPAICVNTHGHRISNRLGLVKTEAPEETERQLKKVLPKKYWTIYTSLKG